MISANPKSDHASVHQGLLAEYQSPDDLLEAARGLREAGYRKLDAHSPFPIHGMDEALRIRPTILPWIVLAAGIIGGVSALAFQWWTNSVDYPYLISGKPLFSLPANIPVTFEVTILLAAFAAFLGMLGLNGLPRLHNPLLHNDAFARVTNDGFFLFVESSDEQYSANTLSELRHGYGHDQRRVDRSGTGRQLDTAWLHPGGRCRRKHRAAASTRNCQGPHTEIRKTAAPYILRHGFPKQVQVAKLIAFVRGWTGDAATRRGNRTPRLPGGRSATCLWHLSHRQQGNTARKFQRGCGPRSTTVCGSHSNAGHRSADANRTNAVWDSLRRLPR